MKLGLPLKQPCCQEKFGATKIPSACHPVQPPGCRKSEKFMWSISLFCPSRFRFKVAQISFQHLDFAGSLTHSLSLDATIMLSKKSSITIFVEHVIIFTTQQVKIASVRPAKNALNNSFKSKKTAR